MRGSRVLGGIGGKIIFCHQITCLGSLAVLFVFFCQVKLGFGGSTLMFSLDFSAVEQMMSHAYGQSMGLLECMCEQNWG